MLNIFKTEENRLPLGIFFISLSVLYFELTLIRLFSIIFQSNLSFLGISIALFGLAVGGIVVYFLPSHFEEKDFNIKLIFLCLSYSLSLAIIAIVLLLPIRISNLPIVLTFCTFIFTSIPFIIANVCLSYIFKIKTKIINKLYFYDLVGAAIGVVLAIILMTSLSIFNVIIVAIITGFIATIIFSNKNKPITYSIFIIIFILVILVCQNQKYNFIKIDIIYSKLNATKEIIFEKSNSFSHISVSIEDNQDGVVLESLSPSISREDMPDILGTRIDVNAYTPIYGFDGDLDKVNFLNSDLSSIAYQISPPSQVLIIGPGGGRNVLMALLSKHKVTGVDINPIIINDMMKNEFKDFSGQLYLNPNVEIIVAEGRSYINKETKKYQVIDLPLVDTWASTSAGNLALVESYLYTVEAFEQYLHHLKKDGLLTITRWNTDGMRIVTLFLEASKILGISKPENNIAIIQIQGRTGKYLNNYIVKTTPFTENEILNMKNVVKTNDFKIIYLPYEKHQNDYNDLLTSKDQQLFIDSYHKDIKIIDDNRPFFFSASITKKSFTKNIWRSNGGIVSTFYIVLLFTLLCLLIPLIYTKSLLKKINKNQRSFILYLGYFSCLGLAFIFIEMSLLQKFILYLEQPIYSYSVILAGLLFFAGIGSYISNNFNCSNKKTFFFIVLSIFVLISVLFLLLPVLINATLSLPIYNKIFISILCIAPLSMLMGMMMPMGLKRINHYELNIIIPWCWAVNGALSVLATVTAIILAINYGFNIVLSLGGIFYIVSFLFILSLKEKSI
ncbi:hypothetical protein KKA15_02965 [Patescibacteria group bacterium]|nr:hypothetical protein [Patescibacteria group bacterium]